MKEVSLFEQSLAAFAKAEAEKWELGQLVKYIIENHVVSSYDDVLSRFIDHREFFLGYLKFEFYLINDEGEPEQIESYYDLHFKLSLIDEDQKEIRTLRDSMIFSKEFVFLFKVPEMDEEIPGLEESVQLAIDQTLAPLDLAKKGNLLAYLQREFT